MCIPCKKRNVTFAKALTVYTINKIPKHSLYHKDYQKHCLHNSDIFSISDASMKCTWVHEIAAEIDVGLGDNGIVKNSTVIAENGDR